MPFGSIFAPRGGKLWLCRPRQNPSSFLFLLRSFFFGFFAGGKTFFWGKKSGQGSFLGFESSQKTLLAEIAFFIHSFSCYLG